MSDLFTVGQLVAIMRDKTVSRICRVVEDTGGPTVFVESDSRLEGEAAVEYDFDTPQPMARAVSRKELKPIAEKQK